jgi:hypothetical protein
LSTIDFPKIGLELDWDGWMTQDWKYSPDPTKSNKAFVDVAVQNTRLVEIFSMK